MKLVLALLLFGLLAAPVAWWHWPTEPLAARFTADQCQRIALTDAVQGRPIVGIEDLAPMPDGRVLLSADDRLEPDAKTGGIYLYTPGGPTDLEPLIGGIRPHGVSLSDDGRTLALIDRSGSDVAVVTGTVSAGGFAQATRDASPALCRANDLAWFFGKAPAGLLVTQDRAECGISLPDLIGLASGKLLAVTPGDGVTSTMPGYRFPNGISGLWISETRAGQIAFFRDTNGGPDTVAALPVPGAPDNLTADGPDALIVGLHRSLPRLGLYRFGWTGRAPSRIARVTYPDAAVEILFDDPAGDVFSGATVGALVGDRLIAGSVRDAGLLECAPG